MNGWRFTLLVAVALLSACDQERQEARRHGGMGEFHAVVTQVSDGDTLTVRKADGQVVKIRLAAVDTPELEQTFGQQARRFVHQRVHGRRVRLRPHKRDRYRRLVATVEFGGRPLSELLLEAGLAWHYKRYDSSTKLATLERRARKERRGLWIQKAPTAPWRWRRNRTRRSRVQPKGGGGSAYVGNLRSKVFHHRSCTNARCRNCRAPFNRKADALAAGYRPHRRCVRGSLLRLPGPR